MNVSINKNKKRPLGVWIISILCLILSAYRLVLSCVMLYAILPHMVNIITAIFVITAIKALTILIGATLLFFLRKQAFYYFAISFVLAIVSTLIEIIMMWPHHSVSSSDIVLVLIFLPIKQLPELGIILAICFYIRSLIKNGVLE